MKNCSLTAVGDMLLTRDLHYHFRQGGVNGVIAPSVRQIFEASDGVIGNVESVITQSTAPMPKGERKPYYFRTSNSLASLLTNLRFTVVTTANNHALDFGARGLIDHRNWLLSNDIYAPGSGHNLEEARDPACLRLGTTIVAVVSVCCVKPKLPCAGTDTPGIARVDAPSEIPNFVSATLREAKKKAHLVLLSPHWIENWVTEPSSQLKQVARDLIDMGFDGILGHSSHLMHGVEVYKGRPIIFDMGTFLSDRISGHQLMPHSAIFSLTITNRHEIASVDVVPVTLGRCRVDLATSETTDYVKRILDRELEGNGVVRKTELGFSVPIESDVQRVDCRLIESVGVERPLSTAQRTRSIADNSCNTEIRSVNADWACSFENGIMLSSVNCVEAFAHRSAFKVDVELANTSPMNGNWIVEVLLRSRDGTREYRIHHPFSQGTDLPCDWSKKGTARDVTIVRPNGSLVPGCYDLFWGLLDLESSYRLKTIQGLDHFFIDTIFVCDGEVPTGCAGVDWSGNLALSVKNTMLHDCVYRTEERVFQNLRERLQGLVPPWGQALEAFQEKYDINPNRDMVFIGVYDELARKLRWGSSRKSLVAVFRRNIEALRSQDRLRQFDLNDFETGLYLEIVKRGQALADNPVTEHELKMSGLSFDLDGKTYRLSPSTAQERQITTIDDKVAFICKANQFEVRSILKRIERGELEARLLYSSILLHRHDNISQLGDERFCQEALLRK